MTVTGAWICLFAPLASALLIALAGQLISRRTAGAIATLATFVAFGGAVWSFIAVWAQSPSDRDGAPTTVDLGSPAAEAIWVV